jgi:hypothetical protein
VLIRSFFKTKVSSMMQIEISGLKNKVSKTQGPGVYLTLFYLKLLILGSNRCEL